MSGRAFPLVAALSGVLLTALSCKDEPGSAPENVVPSPTTDVAQASEATAASPSIPPSPAPNPAPTGKPAADDASLTRPAVERLLQHWLTAQNSRSLDDYAKTYAERFTGLKRMGSHTSRMSRQKWLYDRKQMFPRILRVEAKNIEISVLPQTAILRFEQYWTSANYEDRGTKQMTLVLEEGQPRIAREELLDSRVIDSAQAAGAPVRIVHHFRGKDYLIIGDGATIEKPDLSSGHGTWIAFGSIDTSKEPEIADWQGRALRVFSAAGESCIATGGKVMGIAQALPHFSEFGRWERDKVPTSKRAKIIAEMGGPQFALEIETVGADCGWLVLGQAATQPAPEVAVETADDTAIRLALEAFRKLPQYQSEQRGLDDFRKELSNRAAKPPPQEAWIEYTPVTTSQKSFRLGKEHYVWLSYNAGPGCAGWEGGLAMLFRVELGAAPKATPVPPPNQGSYPTGKLDMLVDTQRDGRVELLLRPTFSAGRELLDERLQPTEALRFVNFDCPC